MPNRVIKESICTSEEIDSLTPEQEIFFYRLMVVVDDFGLMDARPAILKARCYPLKSFDISCIQVFLGVLQGAGLLFLYSVNGKPYLSITNWSKHQQIRAKRAKYPMPNEGFEITCNQLISDAPVIQSNPIQSSSSSDDGLFDEFWKKYPRREGKGEARKAWKKIKSPKQTLAEIVTALGWQTQTEQWVRDNGKFIPHPATYLNQQRWLDEPASNVVSGVWEGVANA